jgi:hypothetical protein
VTRRAISHVRSGLPTMFFEAYFRSDRYYYSVQPDGERGRATPHSRQVSARSSRGRG